MLYFDIQINKALIWTIILLISTLVLISYYCFFCFEFLTYNNSKSPVRPGIAVVVAAHNEIVNLEKLIPLLKLQQYPDFEIIVANDRSKDGTADFLESNSIKHINIRETPDNFSNKKYAITQAIARTEKPIIVLTDADCLPISKDWLMKISEAFLPDIEIVLGYSPYEKAPGLLNSLIRFDTFQGAMLYFSSTLSGNPYMGVGRNIAYKKTLFERIGFKKHREIVGGDDDLFVRDSSNGRNVGIKLDKNAHIVSIPKTSYKEWFAQKRRHQTIGIYYNLLAKFYLGVYQAATMVFYISLFFSFFLDKHTLYIIIIFILRTLMLILIHKIVSKKLEDKFSWFVVPFLDALSVGINTVIGFTVLIRKKVTWK